MNQAARSTNDGYNDRAELALYNQQSHPSQNIEQRNEQAESTARLTLAFSIQLTFEKAVADHGYTEQFHGANPNIISMLCL